MVFQSHTTPLQGERLFCHEWTVHGSWTSFRSPTCLLKHHAFFLMPLGGDVHLLSLLFDDLVAYLHLKTSLLFVSSRQHTSSSSLSLRFTSHTCAWFRHRSTFEERFTSCVILWCKESSLVAKACNAAFNCVSNNATFWFQIAVVFSLVLSFVLGIYSSPFPSGELFLLLKGIHFEWNH